MVDRGDQSEAQDQSQVQSEAKEHNLRGERAEREESGREGNTNKSKHRLSGWDPAWVHKPRFQPWLYNTEHGKYSAVHRIRQAFL